MRRHTVNAIVLTLLLAAWAAAANRYWVYAGTYTGPQSKGIYAFKFDADSGKMEPAFLAGELTRPSFLAIHPNRKYLYAVSELGTSTVSAFEINPKTGMLTLLNTVPAKGSSACHLVVDQTGKSLVVANYGNGGVAVFRVGADGRLSESTAQVQHSGSGPDRSRQRGPHAHAVVLSPDNRFVFVPDLGLDQGVGLSPGPGAGRLDGSRSPVRDGSSRFRPEALRVSPERKVRLQRERDEILGDRVCL